MNGSIALISSLLLVQQVSAAEPMIYLTSLDAHQKSFTVGLEVKTWEQNMLRSLEQLESDASTAFDRSSGKNHLKQVELGIGVVAEAGNTAVLKAEYFSSFRVRFTKIGAGK